MVEFVHDVDLVLDRVLVGLLDGLDHLRRVSLAACLVETTMDGAEAPSVEQRMKGYTRLRFHGIFTI